MAGYSPWGHKELDTTEHARMLTYKNLQFSVLYLEINNQMKQKSRLYHSCFSLVSSILFYCGASLVHGEACLGNKVNVLLNTILWLGKDHREIIFVLTSASGYFPKYISLLLELITVS